MTAAMSAPLYRWREPRLARGWDPVELVLRMKAVAQREGVSLPHAWLLVKVVFLWENHRAGIPAHYDRLLAQVFAAAPLTRRCQASPCGGGR